MNNDELIEKTLLLIKEQTGLNLSLCTHFTGLNKHQGKRYFNIILENRTCESDVYKILERFSHKTNLIGIEPNGVDRVAIFIH